MLAAANAGFFARPTCKAAHLSARHNIFLRSLHWPATPNPTPYEIFGLDPSQAMIDRKKLRAAYYELVKQYHPDRGTTGDSERFKKVVEANNILKDDVARRKYDLSRRFGSSAHPHPYAQYTRQHSPNFEDDMDINYWSNRNTQKFNEGLRESRIWVLKFVTTLTITVALLNLIFLKEASTARNELLNRETENIAAMLASSTSNKGYGKDPQDRINRFLSDRQRMLDKFDREFSWEKFKGGKSRNMSQRQKLSGAEKKPASESGNAPAIPPGPDPIVPSGELTDEIAGTASSTAGKPQMKRHSGPVAEYFGRN